MRQVPLVMSDVQVVFLSCLVGGSASTAEVLCAGQSAFARGGVPSSGRKHAEPGAAQTRAPLAPSPVAPCAEAYQERADITAAEILPSCASHKGCFQNRGRGTQRCDQREGFIEVSCGFQALGLFPDQLCACMAGAALRERGRESISAWLKSPLTSPLAQRGHMEAFSSHGAIFTR